MQAMRIRPVPVGSILGTSGLRLGGVQLPMAMSEVIQLVRLLYAVLLRIVEAVPAPFALRSQGNTVAIVFREGLQTGDVRSKSKATVAHAQRGQGVYSCYYRVVSCY